NSECGLGQEPSMTKGSRGDERKRQPNGQAEPKTARGEAGADAEAPRLSETNGASWNVALRGYAAGSSSGTQAATTATATRPALVQKSDEMRTNDVVVGFGVTSQGKLRTAGGIFVDGVVEGADVESATLSVG